MNILMLSNTYSPHVGGVAKSLKIFSEVYRRWGHRVIIVAPEFENMPKSEVDVIRVPAIQNFNGSDFSVRLPIPGLVTAALDNFQPDIIHSHHPFLLGDTALILSASQNIPLVFTHHTMYERYTHYVPGDSPAMQRFVVELSTGYANLCNLVFAPSDSIAKILKKRGVTTQIEEIPTGVQLEKFRHGDREKFRGDLGIPSDTFLVGHIGRLAPEKNLDFLSRAVAAFCKNRGNAHFLLIGSGPSEITVKVNFKSVGLRNRLHAMGILTGKNLTDAYHAMDVFAFASTSETQGMVLTEAMAAGKPVVAIDAPGVREVVQDGLNGRLLPNENLEDFAAALQWIASLSPKKAEVMKAQIENTAENFSIGHCASKALAHYETLLTTKTGGADSDSDMWNLALRMLETEWEIWINRAHAAGAAIHIPPSTHYPEQ